MDKAVAEEWRVKYPKPGKGAAAPVVPPAPTAAPAAPDFFAQPGGAPTPIVSYIDVSNACLQRTAGQGARYTREQINAALTEANINPQHLHESPDLCVQAMKVLNEKCPL